MPGPFPRGAATAAIALILACCGIVAATPASAAAAVELGVYQCPADPAYTSCDPTDGEALDEYRSEFGRLPAIAANYSSLDQPLLTAAEIDALSSRGVKPMVTVEPYVGGYGKGISLRALAEGDYDSYIHDEAAVAKRYGGELLVRFAHEMNGDWYPWGAGRGSSAQDYVDAWRHYVGVFREDGADNVKFVWAPNVDGGSYPFAKYFPGDSWVDFVALDGYNFGGGNWASFSDTFASSYATLTGLSSRPVMISETGCSESGGDKAAWIRDAFLSAIPQRFPRVAAVVWFNRDFSAAGEQDWRINSSEASLDAYRQVVDSSIYGGSEPAPSPAPGGGSSPEGGSVGGPAAGGDPGGGKPQAAVRTLKVKAPGGKGKAVASSSSVTPAPRAKLPRVRVIYRLSRPAPVRISVTAGRRTVAAVTVSSAGRRGTLRLSRLLHGRSLRPGHYRLVAQPAEGSAAGSRRAGLRLY